jgi:hypothetical protein
MLEHVQVIKEVLGHRVQVVNIANFLLIFCVCKSEWTARLIWCSLLAPVSGHVEVTGLIELAVNTIGVTVRQFRASN